MIGVTKRAMIDRSHVLTVSLSLSLRPSISSFHTLFLSLGLCGLACISAESKPALPSVNGTAPTDAPVYHCMLSIPARGLVIPNCEVVVDSGLLRCDLYSPVRDIVRLQLDPTLVTKQAKSIDSKAITIRQFNPVHITMVFVDAEGKEHPRMAALEVYATTRLIRH